MKTVSPFGFVTACHSGDKFLVHATLASMRHFCPEVPICLLADGCVDVSDLEHQYDLIVIRSDDIEDREMRQLVSGNYRIKLAAMWEGPFEYYVWMDSDAIVWGDFTSQVRQDVDFQIFWSEVSIPTDATEVPPWLDHFYFNLEKLFNHDPGFEWRGHPYFSAGVYACRKNVISWEQWMKVEAWNGGITDGLFRFGDQGILNYLVHSGAQHNRMNVVCSDLQYATRHHGREEISKDIVGCGWRFPRRIERPRAVHFSGQKPYLLNWRAYSAPFSIARLEHQRRFHGELGSWINLFSEEVPIYREKLTKRVRKWLG